MGNDKHVLWQSFLVAIVIFIVGIFLGTLFEQSRVNKIKELYFDAETDLFDVQLQNDILSSFEFDCDVSVRESIDFADRIFSEALLLEKYDDANKITPDVINLHKRYDLLRVSLWKNLILIRENCEKEVNVLVYLYDYVNTPVEMQSMQNAFSNSLVSLKKKKGDELILIPIAYDTGVKSLNIMLKKYNITNYPAVIINDKNVLYDLDSVEDIEKYL